MRTRLTFQLFLILAISLVATPAAYANAITGALPFGAIGVTALNLDLSSSSNTISSDGPVTSGPGTLDLAMVPQGTAFGSFTFDVASVATGAGFSFSNPTYGSFVGATGGIPFQSQNTLAADIFGTFTPGSMFPGMTPTPSEVVIAFTQISGVVSGSFTLETNPGHGPQTPEPQTLLLAGSGILACFGSRILRRLLP